MSADGPVNPVIPSAWLPLLRETLTQEGAFRFPLRGTSMRPTLPVACEIEIVPLPARVSLGALIVFTIDDQLIAHRLVRRSGGRWIAQGDGRIDADRSLLPEQVLGLVAAAYQEGQRCWPTALSHLLRGFWVGRHWALRSARAVQRALR